MTSKTDLTQEWVTKVTSQTDDDGFCNAGGPPQPMPTQEDHRRAHKAEYVRLFVEAGVPEETAAGWHDEDWENIKDGTPQQAFDDQVQSWENDGDF